jgi:HK97 family phage prohead protease
MMNEGLFIAPLELKFVSDSAPGEFEGYAACFGNQDSHGDIIQPQAFKSSLAKHMAEGTMPALHFEHDWAMGGDSMPAGVWTSLTEDGQGLRGKGKISALDTDYGRRVRSLMQDGAVKGLSIAFSIPPGGSERPKSKDGPRRILKTIDLHAVDLVKWPSNPLSRIDNIKSLMRNADAEKGAASAAAAIALHMATMSGNDSPTAEERAQLMNHLQDTHEALTGYRMPKGMKARPSTIREFEEALRELGYSNAEARALAERGFKSATPRDEATGKANQPDASELSSILQSLKF